MSSIPLWTEANIPATYPTYFPFKQSVFVLRDAINQPNVPALLHTQDLFSAYGTGDATDANPAVYVPNGGGFFGLGLKSSKLAVTTQASFAGAVTSTATWSQGNIYTNTNTTDATAVGTGSEQLLGGLSVAKNIVSGAGVTANTLQANATTNATSATTGALQTLGGLGVAKDIYQSPSSNATLGNVTTQNLTVQGNIVQTGTSTTTTFNSNTLVESDNVILVSSGAASLGLDGGLAIAIFQSANNNSLGEVVNSTLPFTQYTVKSTGTATTFVLPASAQTNAPTAISYKDAWFLVTAGTGVGQARRINLWNPTTQTATIYATADIASQNPVASPQYAMDFTTPLDSTSVIKIFLQGYAQLIYSTTGTRIRAGFSSVQPNNPSAYLIQDADFQMATAYATKGLQTPAILGLPQGTLNVEGVNFNQGAITGVTKINGRSVSAAPQTITLLDNDITTKTTITLPNNYGVFMIMVVGQGTAGMVLSLCCRPNSSATGVNWLVENKANGDPSLAIPSVWFNASTNVLYVYHVKAAANPTGATMTYTVNYISG